MMLSAVLDHLWQSTLFAGAACLGVVALRKAPASVRHGLWFTASLKFLIPFSALAAFGERLAPATPEPVRIAPQTAIIDQAARSLARFPLSSALPIRSSVPAVPAAPAVAPHAAFHIDWILVLLVVWAIGCAAILTRWVVRWRRVRAVVRSARPLDWPALMPVVASHSLMEPGLVGLWWPVLVLPESLPERLTRSEIDAILAHETGHLHRRDNLTAAVHTLVEALFWFHPLVWWIGTRLIAERERACDEAVVRAGHDRSAYARGLIECARHYVQSPLSCVAGASGFDLKTRVETIMTAPLSSPLSPLKKTLLLAAGACAVATPVAAGLLTPEAKPMAAPLVAPLARVVAVMTAPVHTLTAPPVASAPDVASSADDDVAPQTVALTQAKAALVPILAVANLDAAPAVLTRDPAAPSLEPGLQAASAPAVDVKKQIASFVDSHRDAFWNDTFVCPRVEGLDADRDSQVEARIQATAKAVGAHVNPVKCKDRHNIDRNNIEVRFAANADQALTDVLADHWLQPWGRTSRISRVNLEALKSGPATVRAWYRPAVLSPSYFVVKPYWRTDFAVVVVDPQAIAGKSLDAISDYVAMLVLSKPRSLAQCSALPSIVDLFSACPGSGALDGLTAADTVYLKALFAGSPEPRGNRLSAEIAGSMAQGLAGDRAAP